MGACALPAKGVDGLVTRQQAEAGFGSTKDRRQGLAVSPGFGRANLEHLAILPWIIFEVCKDKRS